MSGLRNDGGPAFPGGYPEIDEVGEGLSRRSEIGSDTRQPTSMAAHCNAFFARRGIKHRYAGDFARQPSKRTAPVIIETKGEKP